MPFAAPSDPISTYNVRLVDPTVWTMAVNIQYDFSGMTVPDVAVTDEFMQRVVDILVAGGLTFESGRRDSITQSPLTPTPPA